MRSLLLRANNVTMGTTGPVYDSLVSSNEAIDTGTEAQHETLVASSGTLKNLRIKLGTAPGAGTSRTFTVRVNGASTSITLTISGTDTTGSDTSNTASVSAGDRIALLGTVTGAVADTRLFSSLEFSGTTANESLMSGGTGVAQLSTTDTEYISLNGLGQQSAAQATAEQLVAVGGTVKNLYIRLDAAPGVGTSRVFTVFKNGSSTALTVTISGTDTTGSDTTNSVSVSAGDKVSLEDNPSALPPAAARLRHGATFVATTDGEFPILGGGGSNPANNATNYVSVCQSPSNSWIPTENQIHCPGQTCTIDKFYFEVGTAPGAGNTWTLTLRKNAASSGLTMVIADTATTGTDLVNTVSVANDDLLALQSVPFSAPTGMGTSKWGFRGVIESPGGAAAVVSGMLLSMGVG